MKFDVIIGNPPYQLNDGGGKGSSAKPIYNNFIEQAKKLNPRFFSMIIPARWYSGGKGLDDFRESMLNDKNISHLVDFSDSRECFPGVDIAGGVCYFLRQNIQTNDCYVTTVRKGYVSVSNRSLNEFEVFVRDNISITIIHKVLKLERNFLERIVSSRMPFGITSNVKPLKKGEINLIASSGVGFIDRESVKNSHELIAKWKVLLSKASNDHGGQPDKDGRRRVFSRIEVMSPNTVCTESYLVVGSYDNSIEAKNMVGYLSTRFCRFLVSTILLTQNITKSKFSFVPNLPMSEIWTDEKLYKKYGLTPEEIAFIESMIRPMELADE